jgi:hypothetical protein
MIPPRRYPRKIKKKQTQIPLDFSTGEWQNIKMAAKSHGLRPTRYIVWAVNKLVEKTLDEKFQGG